MSVYKCYVDASYSPQKQVGLFAYLIVGPRNFCLIGSEVHANQKNTQLEVMGAEFVINKCRVVSPGCFIRVFSDCQKVERSIDFGPDVEIIKVKGHSTPREKDTKDKRLFSEVDKLARRKLKEIVRSLG